MTTNIHPHNFFIDQVTFDTLCKHRISFHCLGFFDRMNWGEEKIPRQSTFHLLVKNLQHALIQGIGRLLINKSEFVGDRDSSLAKIFKTFIGIFAISRGTYSMRRLQNNNI